MSELQKKVSEISTKVDGLYIHVEYIKSAVDELKGNNKSFTRFKYMTYGIIGFLTVALPLIVAMK